MPIFLTFGIDSVALQVDISGTPGFKILKKIVKFYFYFFILIPFFEKCGMPRLENMAGDLSTEKSKKTDK